MDFIFTSSPLENFLMVGVIMFCCGLYTIMTRKSAIAILMGVELILNATNLNFVAFYRYTSCATQGTVFVIFVILLAAAEAAVALAIFIGIYQNFGRVDVDRVDTMKG
jgi:NADH-quinone oxidoreductase subunit K